MSSSASSGKRSKADLGALLLRQTEEEKEKLAATLLFPRRHFVPNDDDDEKEQEQHLGVDGAWLFAAMYAKAGIYSGAMSEREMVEKSEEAHAGFIANSLSKVCPKAFLKGDFVWECRQCRRDETCVICQDCYDGSNHEGHDVVVHQTMISGGGCCDCGDETAWKRAGFCKRHGHVVEDPSQSLPSPTREHILGLFLDCVKWLGEVGKRSKARFVKFSSSNDAQIHRPSLGLKVKEDSRGGGDKEMQDVLENLAGIAYKEKKSKTPDFSTVLAKGEYTLFNWLEMRDLMGMKTLAEALRSVDQNFFEVCYDVSADDLEAFWEAEDSASVCEFLLKACKDSDAHTRLLSTALGGVGGELENLILCHSYLPTKTRDLLWYIYMRLVVDYEFKMKFARCFAETYISFTLSRFHVFVIEEEMGGREANENDAESHQDISKLSVQFLNRPQVVEDLVLNHGLLSSILVSFSVAPLTVFTSPQVLCEPLEKIIPSLEKLQSDEIFHGYQHMSGELEHLFKNPAVFNSVLGEIRLVFQAPGMGRYFSLDPKTSELRLRVLFSLGIFQGMDPCTRKQGSHVEFESEDWIKSFDISHGLMNAFFHTLKWLRDPLRGYVIEDEEQQDANKLVYQLPQTGFSSEGHLQDMLKFVDEAFNVVAHWISEYMSQTQYFQKLSLFGREVLVSEAESLTMSFHLPLFRFCTSILSFGLCSTAILDNCQKLLCRGTEAFWVGFLHMPLRCLVTLAEIKNGMWVRNGMSIENIASVYSFPSFSHYAMDIDLRSLQLGALSLAPDHFITIVLHAFGFEKLIPDLQVKGDGSEQSKMIESALRLLCVIVTELPFFSRAIEAEGEKQEDNFAIKRKMRRDVIHFLAPAHSQTFSNIAKTCRRTEELSFELSYSNREEDETELLRQVLDEVAQSRETDDALCFELRTECWSEYDQTYYLLKRVDNEHARDRYASNVVKKLPSFTFNFSFPSAPFFPGDSKDISIPLRPYAPELPNDRHTFFTSIRSRLLLSESMFRLVRSVLQDIMLNGSRVGSLLGCLVHLTTLIIHQMNANPLESQLLSAAEEGTMQFKWGADCKPISRGIQMTIPECYAQFLLPIDDVPDSGSILGNLIKIYLAATTQGSSSESASSSSSSTDTTTSSVGDTISWLEKQGIRWILAMLAKGDSKCLEYLSQLDEKLNEMQAGKEGDSDLLQKKRRAQERALERMKAKQNKVASNMKKPPPVFEDVGDEGADDGDNNKGTAVMSALSEEETGEVKKTLAYFDDSDQPECAVCLEKDENKHIGLASFVQKDNVFEGDSDRHLAQWQQDLPRVFGLSKCVVTQCGHGIHFDCFASWSKTLPPSFAATAFVEFLCPLCKTLSNSLLPYIPTTLIPHSLDDQSHETSELGDEFTWNQCALSYGPNLKDSMERLALNFSAEEPDSETEMGTVSYSHSPDLLIAILSADTTLTALSSLLSSTALATQARTLFRLMCCVRVACTTDVSQNENSSIKLLAKHREQLQATLTGIRQAPEVQAVKAAIFYPTKLETFCRTLYQVKLVQCLLDPPLTETTPVKIIETKNALLTSQNTIDGLIASQGQEHIEAALMNFLRFCALLKISLGAESAELPKSREGLVEFVLGPGFLSASSWAPPGGSDWGKILEELESHDFFAWHATYSSTASVGGGDGALVQSYPPSPLTPRALIRPPGTALALYEKANKSTSTAFCLVCGEIMEFGSPGRGIDGNCTKHAKSRHSGICIFVLVKNGKTLLMHNERASYGPPVYFDKHGEFREEGLAERGAPLFLDLKRMEKFEAKFWFSHFIPFEISRVRLNSTTAIQANAY